MTAYLPPKVKADIFNIDDFTQANDIPLTQYDGDIRYIKKLGDVVQGSIIFTGLNYYQNTSTFQADLHVKNKIIKILYKGGN